MSLGRSFGACFGISFDESFERSFLMSLETFELCRVDLFGLGGDVSFSIDAFDASFFENGDLGGKNLA